MTVTRQGTETSAFSCFFDRLVPRSVGRQAVVLVDTVGRFPRRVVLWLVASDRGRGDDVAAAGENGQRTTVVARLPIAASLYWLVGGYWGRWLLGADQSKHEGHRFHSCTPF